jgi:pimeloyl-ACP methyl ester carboxylesterase
MNFNTADVAGLRVFYREAGDPSKPTIVLLHGFPSSSYSFHDLIPLLADRFHVIAPDYPGMGFSDAPGPTVLRPGLSPFTGTRAAAAYAALDLRDGGVRQARLRATAAGGCC